MPKTRSLVALIFLIGFFCAQVMTAHAQVPAPSLPLKDALDVAESSLAQAKISMSGYYLSSATYTNSSKGTFWYLIYKTVRPTTGREINVRVYMNKKTEFSGGYFQQKGYIVTSS